MEGRRRRGRPQPKWENCVKRGLGGLGGENERRDGVEMGVKWDQ